MSKELTTTTEQAIDIKISPEHLEIANTYLSSLSVDDTAQALGISRQDVAEALNNNSVRKYIDTIFLEQGYLNRFKIQSVLSSIIEKKLEELEEAELTSNKDILDLLMAMHKIRMDELKIMNEKDKPVNQQNVQINQYGDNYSQLMSKLLGIDGNK